jgi:phosphatidylserine synthase
MKMTRNDNFGKYFKNVLTDFFGQGSNYFYLGLWIAGFIFISVKFNIESAFRVLFHLINTFTVAFVLLELISKWTRKEIDTNKRVAWTLVMLVSMTISFLFFDIELIKRSLFLGLLLILLIFIGLGLTKIKFLNSDK